MGLIIISLCTFAQSNPFANTVWKASEKNFYSVMSFQLAKVKPDLIRGHKFNYLAFSATEKEFATGNSCSAARGSYKLYPDEKQIEFKSGTADMGSDCKLFEFSPGLYEYKIKGEELILKPLSEEINDSTYAVAVAPALEGDESTDTSMVSEAVDATLKAAEQIYPAVDSTLPLTDVAQTKIPVGFGSVSTFVLTRAEAEDFTNTIDRLQKKYNIELGFESMEAGELEDKSAEDLAEKANQMASYLKEEGKNYLLVIFNVATGKNWIYLSDNKKRVNDGGAEISKAFKSFYNSGGTIGAIEAALKKIEATLAANK